DESSRHGGPPGAETHFAVVVVSGRFAGLPPLQRHRLIHAALHAELAGPLHALAIVAKTPQQWENDPHHQVLCLSPPSVTPRWGQSPNLGGGAKILG
uniref:BolA family member 1 n=1 Tax=Buteo japonicus TaxID=224669 RepID=A0A8B9ZBE9_9AVES